MDSFDHRLRVLGQHVRVDAVPEVEYVPRTRTVAREHARDLVADQRGGA